MVQSVIHVCLFILSSSSSPDDFLSSNHPPCAAICPNCNRPSVCLCSTSTCSNRSPAANDSNYSTASICTASIRFLQSRPNRLQPCDATHCSAIPPCWWSIATPYSATTAAAIATAADATTTEREPSTSTPAVASSPAPATNPPAAELDGWSPDHANHHDHDAGQCHSTAHELDDDH